MAMGEASPTQVLSGIEPLLDRYDGFLVDQFGVLYDGVRLLPGAREALALLRRHGKQVVILSNSGRRAAANAERLEGMGLEPALYTALVSSGEAAWQGLKDGSDEAFAGLGRRCLFFSRGGDRSTVEGLDLELVVDASGADFVLLSGLDPDEDARALCRRELDVARARGLPLVCANPDVVSLEGERRVDGPGAFATRYAAGGGDVRWIGKPWPAVYRAALSILDAPPPRLLAVGDSLEHDIGGAVPFGIEGALVVGGVHGDAFANAGSAADLLECLDTLCRSETHRPRWLLRGFVPGGAVEG
jgi:HAD superfamily hydrolase (TIGR01459 family)